MYNTYDFYLHQVLQVVFKRFDRDKQRNITVLKSVWGEKSRTGFNGDLHLSWLFLDLISYILLLYHKSVKQLYW